MLWLLIALVIDGIDGTFARLFKVKEVLPGWDGTAIDNVIDFCTYAVIPTYFLYETGIIPPELNLTTSICILLTSAMYYGKLGMITEDNYFVGFPVVWNFVVFYFFFVFSFPPMVNFILILIICILHFVPIKYVYPSRTKSWMALNIINTVAFTLANLAIIYLYPEVPTWLSIISIGTIVYYTFASVYHTYFIKPT